MYIQYSLLFFSFYLIIYLFIILFVGFASIAWKCEELWYNSAIMKEISLDKLWNLNDPQFFFQNLLSKNYWWKNTLSLSKVLIYSSTWSLKIIFRFLYIKWKIGLWYIPPYPTTRKLLERKAAWRINTAERISKQSFQAESTYVFLRILFLGKLLYIAKSFHRQRQKKFAKFLVTLQAEGVQWY